MRINYNATGAQRKELVTAIGNALGVKPKYLGMPSAAYQIDYFTVTKDGTIEFGNMADSEEVEKVLEAIADAGFEPEPLETAETEAGETGLTIELPLDKVAVGTLTNILEAKGMLIKKALDIDDLRFEIKEDRTAFPWFPELPDANEVKAYTEFISPPLQAFKRAKTGKQRRKASHE